MYGNVFTLGRGRRGAFAENFDATEKLGALRLSARTLCPFCKGAVKFGALLHDISVHFRDDIIFMDILINHI